MKEIESLVERAKRYIKSAEVLLKDGDYESSVSRTYYAMLCSILLKQFYSQRTYRFHPTEACSLLLENISSKQTSFQRKWAENSTERLKTELLQKLGKSDRIGVKTSKK